MKPRSKAQPRPPMVRKPASCAVIPPPSCTSVIATIRMPAVALSRKLEIVAPV